MDRRTFAFSSLAAACATPPVGNIFATEEISTAGSSAENTPIDFQLEKSIDLKLKSRPVMWQGGPVHLVKLHQVSFSLESKTKRLTANVKGALLTFDNVDYDISLVVFDDKGQLLGSSSVVCPVPRIWLGVYASQPIDLLTDFGISRNFTNASRFLACISDRNVLTPEQWQKG